MACEQDGGVFEENFRREVVEQQMWRVASIGDGEEGGVVGESSGGAGRRGVDDVTDGDASCPGKRRQQWGRCGPMRFAYVSGGVGGRCVRKLG